MRHGFLVLVLTLFLGLDLPASGSAQELAIEPSSVTLNGNFDTCQLLVYAADSAGQWSPSQPDYTADATYATSDETIVRVSPAGRLTAVGNGKAVVAVSAAGQATTVRIEVSGVTTPAAPQYLRDISPILSKAGCNQGACHASQHGKGGLKLSVLAYAPDEDYEYLVRDQLQRRVNLLEPDQSLLLQKPTMAVPHGGGRRLAKDSLAYEILSHWIARGAPRPKQNAAHVQRLLVYPPKRVGRIGMKQQMRVEAEYSDGTLRDVTAWAKYDSMDEGMLDVSDEGLVTAVGQGQAPIMIRFEGQAEVALFSVPYQETVELADWTSQNYIDELAVAKFQELGIAPAPLCDDATFLRRVYLDTIGALPTVEETRAFLEDADPAKRSRLVDRLLGLTGDPALDIYNDRYAAFWTLKWSDLIRASSKDLGEQGMWALHNWIRESFRTNKPYDQFVRELVLGKGSVYSDGPANYFLINRDSSALAEATSQLFLGVRLECAKCHHHPFERYSQADYYSFAAFFSRVGLKSSEEFGIFGGERVVMVRAGGDVRHPKTGQVLPPKPLEGEPMDDPLDRRLPLAQWLTAKDNDYFKRAAVNRYVAHFLGRGLVDPVDDLRATNPPANPALMEALAERFAQYDFNLKLLIRDIISSRLYQLDSQPTAANQADLRFYSHYYVKRLAAEPLLDALDAVTAVQTKFQNLPGGTRAIELPDAEYANYFLNTFGKPRRVTICDCERSKDPNLTQALHTLNGDTLMQKIVDEQGRIAALATSSASTDEVIETLYLAALCRYPRPDERQACQELLQQWPTPREGYEDLLWALVNSKEFLFIH